MINVVNCWNKACVFHKVTAQGEVDNVINICSKFPPDLACQILLKSVDVY